MVVAGINLHDAAQTDRDAESAWDYFKDRASMINKELGAQNYCQDQYVDRHAVAALELLVRAYVLIMHDMLSWPKPVVRLHKMQFVERECGIKLMTKLQELYHNARKYKQLQLLNNEPEFLCYALLQNLSRVGRDPEGALAFHEKLYNARPAIWKAPSVALVVQLLNSVYTRNTVRFFRTLRQLPPLVAAYA